MQLRYGGEHDRPKKSDRNESGSEITGMRFRAVSHLRVSFSPRGVLRKNISVRSTFAFLHCVKVVPTANDFQKSGDMPAATLQLASVS
jgi:hypothetical protein